MRYLALTVTLALAATAHAAPQRPNILLMMVDDLGFADFGCYGSEIETPHIDRLAADGLRFSQFYNTAKCHSSRVSLLSGLYCNQAGSQKLSRATTIAEVLGRAGYFTSMAGKWHLSRQPTDFGFQRYWGHLSGATDFFIGDDTFRLNGKKWDEFHEGFYTTDANVDYSMRFIDEALESGKPFFHYIAFNAPHYPLQAPKEDIEKYLGRYDAGWQVIRAARFAKQKQLGIFPDDMELPPLPKHMPSWDKLSKEERTFESFRMAIFAAMVDRVDQNIGRMIAYLKRKGQFDNTLIILCSDNGACPFERSKRLDIPPWQGKSFYLYDASWATVGNTPLRHYKQTQHEGGISSPLIVHWPGQLRHEGSWVRSPGHLIDIMATCIEVADAEYPTDGKVEPLQGKSLLPLFKGKGRPGHDQLYFQFSSCRALRQGDWKVVSFYGHQWELYNIAEDRCEQNNLAARYPDRVERLSEKWHEMAENTDQLSKKQSAPVKSTPSPNSKNTWHNREIHKEWKMPQF
ncbi:MAG: arylsulfatase [Planctomycetes bacterium]|nr:arylsulfatase [Planctomycetota bacterium]